MLERTKVYGTTVNQDFQMAFTIVEILRNNSQNLLLQTVVLKKELKLPVYSLQCGVMTSVDIPMEQKNRAVGIIVEYAYQKSNYHEIFIVHIRFVGIVFIFNYNQEEGNMRLPKQSVLSNQKSTHPYNGRVHRCNFPGVHNQEIGLGDVIKNLTNKIGFSPCGGCQKRAEALNRWLVFVPRYRK